MDERSVPGRSTAEWLRPRTESEGLVRYIATVRERWWLVVLTTIVAVALALAYVVIAPKVYEGEADMLVTPVSSGDATTAGLGLIADSSDPTQDISTAARLVATTSVAKLVKDRLRLPGSPEDILGDIVVEPIAQSNLVAVRASQDSAAKAAGLANAFAQAAVDVRTKQLHEEIAAQLPQLTERLRAGQESLSPRVSALTSLSAGADPTIRVATSASPPSSPSAPKPKLALAAGLLGGLILGLGAAFASQALDPRLRREEQIRELFRLPLLARVPKLAAARPGQPVPPSKLSAAAVEAYRTLRATLTAAGDARSVLVTSSTAGEGKTTTAVNLAYVLAQAGHKVILVEGDMRRPSIVESLHVRPTTGIGAVLIGWATLEDALLTSEEYGENLSFLLAERVGGSLADRLSLPAARQLIADAEQLADYVIVDSPPLTEVVDALPLAQRVDTVVIVARAGVSRLNRLRDLGDMLAQGGITPAGVVLTGAEGIPDSPYYFDAEAPPTPVS
jgi:capsular exopolysaccharide synthesis family protein